ncbi:hypothetical protein Syun_001210 [Stephania yunnanensis]|uniref:Uncharacterized protein n=1 Tax=Stephania yunnanensis TaxID=152371 RepID=A0AAP0LEB0_9MAGN
MRSARKYGLSGGNNHDVDDLEAGFEEFREKTDDEESKKKTLMVILPESEHISKGSDEDLFFGSRDGNPVTKEVGVYMEGRGGARWRESDDAEHNGGGANGTETRHTMRGGGSGGGGRRTSSERGMRADCGRGSAEQQHGGPRRGERDKLVIKEEQSEEVRGVTAAGERGAAAGGTPRLSGGEEGGPVKEEVVFLVCLVY